MPVRKFKRVEEMDRASWLAPDDPALLRRIAYVWTLARKMSPRRFPPGVYKHRSIEALNEQCAEWERSP